MVRKLAYRRIAEKVAILGTAAGLLTLILTSLPSAGPSNVSTAEVLAPDANSSAGVGNNNCPPLMIIGVRGSRNVGENDNVTTDKVLNSVEGQLKNLVPGAQAENTFYPAVPVGDALIFYGYVYDTSINSGKSDLHEEIVDFFEDCPDTAIVLVGYSQGAQIVEQVYLTLPSTWQRKIIVDLFGDPIFDGSDRGVDQGTYTPRENGVAGVFNPTVIAKFPPQLDGNVHSYCIANDPVCNYTQIGLERCLATLITQSCAHFRYVTSNYTGLSASWVESRWLTIRSSV